MTTKSFREVVAEPFTVAEDGTRTLQCHSKGDLRFSPFGAKVAVDGNLDHIENHYQRAKVFEGGIQPVDWRMAKKLKDEGRRQIGWKIGPLKVQTRSNGKAFAIQDFGIQFYCLLWAKYILANPELIAYASTFDHFEDPYAGNFPFSQAKVWELVTRDEHGVEKLLEMGAELSKHLRAKS